MPAIAWLRAPPAQPAGDYGPELQHPAPHRFVGDLDPTLGEQFLDVAVAQGEAEIQPDRLLDDLGREAMAAVAEQGHDDTLPDPLTGPGFRDNASARLFVGRMYKPSQEKLPSFSLMRNATPTNPRAPAGAVGRGDPATSTSIVPS